MGDFQPKLSALRESARKEGREASISFRSPNGVLGDPVGASAAIGNELLEAVTDRYAEIIRSTLAEGM